MLRFINLSLIVFGLVGCNGTQEAKIRAHSSSTPQSSANDNSSADVIRADNPSRTQTIASGDISKNTPPSDRQGEDPLLQQIQIEQNSTTPNGSSNPNSNNSTNTNMSNNNGNETEVAGTPNGSGNFPPAEETPIPQNPFPSNLNTTTVFYLTYGNFDRIDIVEGATAWEVTKPKAVPSECLSYLENGPWVQYVINNRDKFPNTDSFVECLENNGAKVRQDFSNVNLAYQPHSVSIFVTPFEGDFANMPDAHLIRYCRLKDAGGTYISSDPNCGARAMTDAFDRPCLTFADACDESRSTLKTSSPNYRPAFKASVAARRASAGLLSDKKRCLVSTLSSIDAGTISSMLFGGAPMATQEKCIDNIKTVVQTSGNKDSRRLHIHWGFKKIGEIVNGVVK